MRWDESTLRRAEALIAIVVIAVLLVAYVVSRIW